MKIEQVNNQIRCLSRSDKMKIYKWIDEETKSIFSVDLMGAKNRQVDSDGAEQKEIRGNVPVV